MTIVYRMITFYLPPIWGAGAMGWLRAGFEARVVDELTIGDRVQIGSTIFEAQ